MLWVCLYLALLLICVLSDLLVICLRLVWVVVGCCFVLLLL